jgi:peptidoglycan/LPS O-acetylase OafA/YrhL
VPTKTHIAYLDSIRGLAALAVISEHYIIGYGLPCKGLLCEQMLDYSPLHFWWDGGAAVSMFFVLSGLVLSIKYFRHGNQPHLQDFSLPAYIIARLFRIWAPYCVVLLLSACLYQLTTSQPFLNTALPSSAWLSAMWNNHPLSITDMFREAFLLRLPNQNVLLPQAWTLSIELTLSLSLPIGLLLAARSNAWLIFFALLAVSFLGVSVFLLDFVFGLLIARYHAWLTDYLQNHYALRRLLLFAGFLLYSAGSSIPPNVNENIFWLCSGVGAALLIVFVLGSLRSQAILSKPLLRHIGKVSYSAYLLHMAVLMCLTPYILKGLEAITGNLFLLWLGGWLLTVAIVQLLSLASYHWLETPSISLGRWVLRLLPRFLTIALISRNRMKIKLPNNREHPDHTPISFLVK